MKKRNLTDITGSQKKHTHTHKYSFGTLTSLIQNQQSALHYELLVNQA